MASTSKSPRDDRPEVSITRIIGAPPKLVFEAWSQPDHLVHWYGPSGFKLPHCELDFRVGGAYRFGMLDPSGGMHWLRGHFHEIVEAERLVFTFAWENDDGEAGPQSIVTLIFRAKGDTTELTLHHTGFESDAAARDHADGWSQAVERLREFATKGARS